MHEQLLVRLDVAVEIHADEAVELQEARIDVAHEAGIGKRHLGDDVVAEPVGAALLGEPVHAVGLTRVSIGPPISIIETGT